MKSAYKIGETDLVLLKGDITDQNVDVIVNAANAQLILGSGVAGAIRERGGEQIQEECNRLGGTYVGGAVMTGGGNLKAQHVIHAVGPKQGEGDEETKLRNATMNSLLLAEEHDLESIAFPAISTGVYGFPINKCADIMLTIVVEFLKRPTKLKKVVFCLWDEQAYKVFKDRLENLL